MILTILILNCRSPISADPGKEPIHTRISSVELPLTIRDGYPEYHANVTVVLLKAEIEVWNTDTETQNVGYTWWAPSCGEQLTVVSHVTDNVDFYMGEEVTQTTCSLAWPDFEPGLMMKNSWHKLVFDTVELSHLPNGEYVISAPTDNGVAYTASLKSNNGVLEFDLQEVPENWGEAPSDDLQSDSIEVLFPLDWILGLTTFMAIIKFIAKRKVDM